MANVEVIFKTIKEGMGDQELNQSLDQTQSAAGGAQFSFTELNSAIQIGQRIMEAGVQIYDATIQKTIDYAASVEELSQISGQSAEDTSRLISMTAQYGVSTEALTMANKKLANEGLTLSIDTLAKLSDQYNSLSDNADRAKFLTDNFGRSGYQLVDIMQLGSEAIRRNSDEINANLIMTQKQIEQAKEFTIMQEKTKQQWEGISIAIGNAFMPVMYEATQVTNEYIQVVQKNGFSLFGLANAWDTLQLHVKDNTERLAENALATQKNGMSQADLAAITEATTQAENEQAKALQTLTGEEKNRISGVLQLQSINDTYSTSMASLNKQYADEKQAMQDDIQKYGEQDSRINAHKAKLDELQQKMSETAKAQENATHRMEFSMMEQVLAADGLTKGEAEALLKQGEQWGLFTTDTVNEFDKMIMKVHEFDSAFNDIPTEKKINIDIYINAPKNPYIDQNIPLPPNRATGGPVSPGQTYVVGENGPEILTMGSGQQGYITANEQIGANNSQNLSPQHVKDLTAAINQMANLQRMVPDMIARAVRDQMLMVRR